MFNRPACGILSESAGNPSALVVSQPLAISGVDGRANEFLKLGLSKLDRRFRHLDTPCNRLHQLEKHLVVFLVADWTRRSLNFSGLSLPYGEFCLARGGRAFDALRP